jgi:glycine/D-amino acid oxidase-like deaminating enzyme
MPSAVVVGAGIFGGSLAHELVERGWEVSLVDRYPPGHVRAASSGESRLIRAAHGSDTWYVRSVRRAWERWRRLEEETGASLLVPCGVVWLAHSETGWEADSEGVLAAEGVPTERLAPEDASSLFPSFTGDDLAFCLLEPEAGVLRARDATRAVVSLARSKGARFVGGEARPAADGGVDVEGERLTADVVVWACGAWLAGIFPTEARLRVTRQEVLHFGSTGGASRSARTARGRSSIPIATAARRRSRPRPTRAPTSLDGSRPSRTRRWCSHGCARMR